MNEHPVLVVDDDPYILEALSLLLELEGYPVETAADGWDALVRIRRVNADVLIAGSSLTVSLQQSGAPFIRRVGYESLTGVGYRPRTGWRSPAAARAGC